MLDGVKIDIEGEIWKGCVRADGYKKYQASKIGTSKAMSLKQVKGVRGGEVSTGRCFIAPLDILQKQGSLEGSGW